MIVRKSVVSLGSSAVGCTVYKVAVIEADGKQDLEAKRTQATLATPPGQFKKPQPVDRFKPGRPTAVLHQTPFSPRNARPRRGHQMLRPKLRPDKITSVLHLFG